MSSRRVEIFCPKCKWHPRPSDMWDCSCHHTWNTFETCGTCPECGQTWEDTQCLSCHKWSRHCDWYHEYNPDEKEKEECLIEESQPAPNPL